MTEVYDNAQFVALCRASVVLIYVCDQGKVMYCVLVKTKPGVSLHSFRSWFWITMIKRTFRTFESGLSQSTKTAKE
jgi:hypothetical protein